MNTATHFRLWLLRSVLALIERATPVSGSLDDLLARHPVLQSYIDEAAHCGLDGLTLHDALTQLDDRLDQFAVNAGETLPLERLRRALGTPALGIDALSLSAQSLSGFLLCGLADEDPRLAPLVDELLGHDGRASRAMLTRCFDAATAPRTPATPPSPTMLPTTLAALLAAGFLREELLGRWRLLSVPPAVWDVLHGLPPPAGEWRFTPLHELPLLTELILPEPLLKAIADQRAAAAPAALCWALRGAPGSGRRALAGALARSTGLGLIEPASTPAAPHPLSTMGALATLLGAMPLLTLHPAPGERLALPELPGYRSALAVRLPCYGGLTADRRMCRWLELGMPSPQERRRHWRLALSSSEVGDDLIGLRVPRGTLHRVARAVPPGCADPLSAVMAEVEERGRFALDGVAHRVAPVLRGEAFLLVDEAREEFAALLARCRHREALGAALPAAFGHASAAGVRALFKGPSGTGKTLAARHLAAEIGRPLYRVDLAATVSKYIGETERNLERVFEAAESLDIVLLIDEGDALMAGRTGVSSSTDRYANLETNYLLQRLEAYAGILIVTTNAPERIDSAFARRMDVTLEFPLPDADTRFDLWLAHLAADNAISDTRLDEVALRCALSGGQIRNAALHATLLSLQQGSALGDAELLNALQREYRKAGLSCPSLSASV